jgi:hypothetical protein
MNIHFEPEHDPPSPRDVISEAVDIVCDSNDATHQDRDEFVDLFLEELSRIVLRELERAGHQRDHGPYGMWGIIFPSSYDADGQLVGFHGEIQMKVN